MILAVAEEKNCDLIVPQMLLLHLVTNCYPTEKHFSKNMITLPSTARHKWFISAAPTITVDDKKGVIMLRKLTIIAVVALIGIGSTFFVGCQHRGHQRGAAFMMDYLAEALDLTEAQQAMANSYKDEILAKVKGKHSEKRKIHDELKAQLGGDTIDTVRVKALVAEHRAGMDDVIDLIVDRVAELHATLSPEQREKLVSKLEKFEKRHQTEWDQ